jgi:hypothetical protein
MNFIEAGKLAKEQNRPFGRKGLSKELLFWDGIMLKLLIYAHFGTGMIPYQAIDHQDIFAEDWELK